MAKDKVNAVDDEIVDEETGEITVAETTSITTSHRGASRGLENVDIGTITFPVAKLLQSMSAETQDRDYDFKAGEVIHSLFMERLGDHFVPISIQDTNAMFVPKNDAEKRVVKDKIRTKFNQELSEDDMKNLFICRASDGRNGDRFGKCSECQLNKFDGADKPVCTASINVMALMEGTDTPVIIRFANTSYKHGKKLKDLLFLRRRDTFANKFKLTPMLKMADGNSYYEATVKPAGQPTPEEYAEAEAMYNAYLSAQVDYDVSVANATEDDREEVVEY